MDDFLERVGEAGFGLDDEGRPDGWHTTGNRESRLAEWRWEKEEQEFEELCKQLQKRNYSKRYLDKLKSTPEGRERLRAIDRRYKRRHRERILRELHERRVARYKANPRVCTCRECGATWCPLYGVRASSFCSMEHRNRWHAKRLAKLKNRGLRDMSLRDRVEAALRMHRWLSAPELVAYTEAKEQSLLVCLGRWARDGSLRRRGRKREFEYALPEGGEHA